jgi:peptidoglycan/LPS O-acetylase OafA/YrhL
MTLEPREPAPPVAAVLIPRRFHSLDVLRGVAALCVVIYHWQLFFRDFRAAGKPLANYLPLWPLFSPVYEEGRRAVDLFFSLSGFIFFWLYAEGIRRGRVGGKEFAALRLSRLYPLHLATLLLVVLEIHFASGMAEPLFETHYNDGYHFLLQLFMASSWGFEKGFSFNGPIWSVSVEVLLYIAFFFLCRANLGRWWQLVLLVLAGFALNQRGIENIGRGVFSFFLGGLAFKLFLAVRKRGWSMSTSAVPATLIAALWVCIPLNAHYQTLYHVYGWLGGPARLTVAGKDLIGGGILQITSLSHELILFPATIFLLALWEASKGSLGSRCSFLGDISYSSYLLHYPLHVSVYVVLLQLGFGRSVFSSPVCLFVFMAGLVAASWACHHWFERPAQSLLRNWFGLGRAAAK